MFPARENSKYLAMTTAVLLIAIQLVFLGSSIWRYTYNSDFKHQESKQTLRTDLKDNWELLAYEADLPQQDGNNPDETDNKESKVNDENISKVYQDKALKIETDANENDYNVFKSAKVDKLAQTYQVDPEYLDYIIKVEKTFDLEPCELLAVIAQESGFKPQTHMDGGSLSYNTTQMKMPTAKTAYMAITQYYKMDIPVPTHEILNGNKYYAAFLAGGYLRYLDDVYQDKYESYTAYNWGIGGRMTFYQNNGHFKSPYALKVAGLGESFQDYLGQEYYTLNLGQTTLDFSTFEKNA